MRFSVREPFEAGSGRLAGQECVAEDLELSRPVFAARATEGIHRRADLDVDETALFQQSAPACTRQAAGDSGGPEVNVADGVLRHLRPVGDVGKL